VVQVVAVVVLMISGSSFLLSLRAPRTRADTQASQSPFRVSLLFSLPRCPPLFQRERLSGRGATAAGDKGQRSEQLQTRVE